MLDIEDDSQFDGSALAAAFDDVAGSCEPNLPGLVAAAVDRGRRARRNRTAWQVAGSAALVVAVGAGAAFLTGGRSGDGHAVDPASGSSAPLRSGQAPLVDIGRTGPVALSLVPQGVTGLPDPVKGNNDIIVGDGGSRSAQLTVILYPDSHGGSGMTLASMECANVLIKEPKESCTLTTLQNGDLVQATGGPSTKYPGEIIYTVLRLTPGDGILDLSEDLTAPEGSVPPISLDQLTAMAASPKWTPFF